MNRVQPDNVHSTIFTPQEYQVELIDSCLQGNTVAVLASRSTRTFLVTMVTRELSHQTRSSEQGGFDQRTLIIGKSGPKLVKAGEAIQQNTNLAVATYTSLEQVKEWTDKWSKVFLDSQVIVMTSDVLETGLETGYLQFDILNLFVITDAHLMLASSFLKEILRLLTPNCRVLAMTSSVLSHAPSPPSLDSLLSYLRKTTMCRINTSSELVTILRYVNKPHERFIMCASPFYSPRPDPESEVRRLTGQAMNFLEDHRYDLVEVYGPEYAEFCVGVPDPIREPKQILKEFIEILDNLGLWCADRAALYSLVEIEKLKRKTAYDRHYLLLCLIFSVMARVRAVIESAFENHSELNQILNFSTPKVLRLIDVLRQIRPLNFVDPRKRRERIEALLDKEKSELTADDKKEKVCSKCDCARKIHKLDEEVCGANFSLEKNPLPDATSEIVPTIKMEKGCDNDEELHVCSSVLSGRVGEDGVDFLNVSANQSSSDELPNIFADCDSFHSADEDLSKSGCDPVTSTSYLSSTLQKSDSEDSIYESDASSCSIPPSSPIKQTVPSCESPSNEHSNAKPALNDSVIESTLENATEVTHVQELPTKVENNDDICLCDCHNVNKRTSTLCSPLTNGCESSEDYKDSNSAPAITETSSKLKSTNANNPDIFNANKTEVPCYHSYNNDVTEESSLHENTIEIKDQFAENNCSAPDNQSFLNNVSEVELCDGCEEEESSITDHDISSPNEVDENSAVDDSLNKTCETLSPNRVDEKSPQSNTLSANEVDENSPQSNTLSNNEVDENSVVDDSLNKTCETLSPNRVDEKSPQSNTLTANEVDENSPQSNTLSNNEVNENFAADENLNKTQSETLSPNEIHDKLQLNDSLNETRSNIVIKPISKSSTLSDEDTLTNVDTFGNTNAENENTNEVNNLGNESRKKQEDPGSRENHLIEGEVNLSSSSKMSDEPKDVSSSDDNSSLSHNQSFDLETNSVDLASVKPSSQRLKDTSLNTEGKNCSASDNDCGEHSPRMEQDKPTPKSEDVTENTEEFYNAQEDIGSNEEIDEPNDNLGDKSSEYAPAKTGTSEAMAMADTLAQLLPNVTKPKRRREEVKEKIKVHNPDDPDSVCGLIFVRHRTTAKIIYRLLKELSDIGGNFSWIFPQYTVELCKNANEDAKAAEAEHKKQEEVLRRFRHHECNLLVSTAVLEEGIDIPNCNLVLRFDPAPSYSSYVYSRGRATGNESFYFHLVVKEEMEKVLDQMASFTAYENVLLTECESVDLGTDSEVTSAEADAYGTQYITSTGASVSMSSAIALLNRYCAKLPSDTFTRLTAMWTLQSREEGEKSEYRCVIMLPINSPLKGYTEGLWMPKKSLAKMSGALICCQRLHAVGELNDSLMPVGKESMQLDAHLCAPLPDDQVSEGMPRPGSTKRRQYYYKKVAECLVGEEPNPSVDLWVYKLDMFLTCPIPDEQNTRGRKIYRPELSARSLGLVTTKPIPQISGFPVFTRSGEVMVRLKKVGTHIKISEEKLEGLRCFHMFTFTHVLRLEKYPIKFHPSNAKTTFFVAPLLADNSNEIIDWDFVKLIEDMKNDKPTPPSEEERKNFKFKQSLYQDAVVMPWYRNQDQPQYFYVAEICSHLHPQSDFPDAGFESFEKYYLTKYGIQIYNLGQPLLDVDHTSGRLNLLTPRHVNRKGVALPTTSEETKKAKRENLQQKQILVPELCTIHPFPASLWRKAVCLPTILYRINGLLLANELRVRVACEIGLGLTRLLPDFEWPNLDFGWTLADVLARSLEASKNSDASGAKGSSEKPPEEKPSKVEKSDAKEFESKESKKKGDEPKGLESRKGSSELEIGTWSNDMALASDIEDGRENYDDFEIENFDPNIELPDNLTMLDGSCAIDDDIEGELGADWGTGLTERKSRIKDRGDGVVRVGSPSNFESDGGWDAFNGVPAGFGPFGAPYDDYYDYCDDFDGYESEQEYEEETKEREEAEWEEQVKRRANEDKEEQSDEEEEMNWPEESLVCPKEKEEEYERMIEVNKEELRNSKIYVAEDDPIIIEKSFRKKQCTKTTENGIQTDDSYLANCNFKTSAEKSELISGGGSGDEISKETNTVTHAEKATQTDDVAFATNTEPEIGYNVDRETTLLEVKTAYENMPPLPIKDENEEPLFSFDKQPDLEVHPGPPPSIVLQALTMSNANDGVNLERLETIGDSYLKYAITNYLYCTHTQKHEGKLSYLRSKQVSNLNLYRLGKRKGLGECMVATKFEPHDNWLPPGYFVPKELEEALIDSGVPAGHWNMADFPGLHDLGSEEIRRLVQERSEQIKANKAEQLANELIAVSNPQDLPIFIPYNLLTQHSIPDKSISDCVEALIGAYLTTCGPRGALLFMSWLGIKVLPSTLETSQEEPVITYHQLQPPSSPLNSCPLPDANEQLELLLSGYEEFEKKIGYTFRDRSYLLQAFTHASYYRNRLTDCYQRLEFLGDAVLDYLITRHLFEDKRQHSPGSLTDLRSALVNNTIFACLAVKFEFHKYFRHFSPGLDRVVRDFVRMQEENGHKINEEYYFMEEEECEAAEDIEVPKALGDVFESVAGAVFLDSGGSLDAVWRVYYSMMKNEIEQFSGVVPKSPIRELLETEPETAKFGKPERLVDGKVRVSVEIFGKGCFSGVGRNYRIAKSTAAKRALRQLKKLHAMAHPESALYSCVS